MPSAVVCADGYSVPAILEAILQLFPLDWYVDKPVAVMRNWQDRLVLMG